jgi:hypothetical protein
MENQSQLSLSEKRALERIELRKRLKILYILMIGVLILGPALFYQLVVKTHPESFSLLLPDEDYQTQSKIESGNDYYTIYVSGSYFRWFKGKYSDSAKIEAPIVKHTETGDWTARTLSNNSVVVIKMLKNGKGELLNNILSSLSQRPGINYAIEQISPKEEAEFMAF